MINLNSYVNFLIQNDITQEQLLFLKLVYHERIDLIRKYKNKFPNGEGGMISKYLIKDLINKEFLIPTKTGFKIGEKFKNIYVDGDLATEEVFNIYPSFILSDKGVEIPLTAMDRNIFKNIYMSKIMGDLLEHEQIIKDINYGVSKHLIKVGINKFLTSEQWKPIRKRRIEEKEVSTTVVNDMHDEDF